MKYVRWLVCVIVLLLVCSTAVSAGSTQRVALTAYGNSLMLTAEEEPTNWERPLLSAGQALSEPGSLILANDTDTAHTLQLDHVALPYEDEALLEYLNHVNIVVRDGETVLYDGPYSRINDEGGLALSYPLAAGDQVLLSIDLRCDYTCPAEMNGFTTTSAVIDWKFYTVVETPVPEQEKPAAAFSDPALREILIAAAAAVLLLAGVGVYELVRRRR